MPEFNPPDQPNGRPQADGAQRIIEDLSALLAGREAALASLTSRVTATEACLNNIVSSRAWRWVSLYGRLKNRIARSARRLFHRAERQPDSAAAMASGYQEWVKTHDLLTDDDRRAIRVRSANLNYQPLISVVLPLLSAEEEFTRLTIESVCGQLYQNWELCIAQIPAAEDRVGELIREFAKEDPRIKIVDGGQDDGFATLANRAVDMAQGDFIGFLNLADEVAEHALYMVAELLNSFSSVDLIYTDEDSIAEGGQRSSPHFKTNWNRDLFYSGDCVSHLMVYRSSLLKRLGGFRSGYDGIEEYDLALRATEQIPDHRIHHIPLVLYHQRQPRGSSSSGGVENGVMSGNASKAIREHFERMRIPVTVTSGQRDCQRVIYPLPDPVPLVSLVIATRDRVDLLSSLVHGLFHETDYDRFELVIVNNQSTQPETLKYLDDLNEDSRVTVINYDAPFNFSAMNNIAVRRSQGEVIGLLNNDLKIISPGWLREMVSHALRPAIGAVGAKLYYPNDTIQHGGIIVGLGGLAGYAHRHLHRDEAGHGGRPHKVQNYSAVTGACMVMRRAVFSEVGGFDEINLPVAYNDVDLCLRIRERGYRIVWTPYAELYHLESASRPSDRALEQIARYEKECAYFRSRWRSPVFHDPYYNPNLSLEAEDFSLASLPRVFKPWQI